MSHNILDARESRFDKIILLAKNHEFIVSLKANIPGDDKNIYASHFLTSLFENELKKKFTLDYINMYEGSDGPFLLCSIVSKNGLTIKKALIDIENNHPLGRLIDLDLYIRGQMVSRSDLNISKRKCLICDNDAAVCSRNKTHSTFDLLNIIDDNILKFLKTQVSQNIDMAILQELNLEIKFGLVTPSSSGSHPDMNYELMFNSKEIIIPHLVRIFELGFLYPDDKDLLEKARLIGIEAETQMFDMTKQINTYKGLIYILGFVLLSLGILVKKNRPLMSIYQQVKELAQNILLDFEKDGMTAGQQAYSKYRMLGIRGEVFNGLGTIQKANRYFKSFNISDSNHQHAILLYIILNAEDTVLLKRAGSIENYNKVKQLVEKLNPYDSEELLDFTTYCIEENLSFGGSADLFIVFHFLGLIKNLVD